MVYMLLRACIRTMNARGLCVTGIGIAGKSHRFSRCFFKQDKPDLPVAQLCATASQLLHLPDAIIVLLRTEKLTVMCGSQQLSLIASRDVGTQTLSNQRRPSARPEHNEVTSCMSCGETGVSRSRNQAVASCRHVDAFRIKSAHICANLLVDDGQYLHAPRFSTSISVKKDGKVEACMHATSCAAAAAGPAAGLPPLADAKFPLCLTLHI